jgi:membrane protein
MANRDGNGAAPGGPTDLHNRDWRGVLRRTVREFRHDNLTDWAAALTYYGVLALFPAIVALVSIVGFLGKSTVNSLVTNVKSLPIAPEAKHIVVNTITNLSNHKGSAGIALVIGFAVALWSASGYIGAFIRASNAVYEVREGRPFYRLRPLQLGVTLLMLVLIALSAAAVVVTGPLTDRVGHAVGLGNNAQTIFDIAKWPVILVVVSFMVSLLYYAAPNVRQQGFRWITPGSVLAVVLWLVASVAFAIYVKNFGHYDKTYGSLGGVIVFLIWLWISNIAVLLGQELNAEVERGRELSAGLPAEREIQLPPRVAPKETDR